MSELDEPPYQDSDDDTCPHGIGYDEYCEDCDEADFWDEQDEEEWTDDSTD